MDPSKHGIDLEKELSCSICTELLFEPLTLLDCLHTFCGSCLTEWFSWQLTAAENSPNPPSPGSKLFTCPSCRANVRDTRHNATVATLLEMFLTAHPNKARKEEEKAEMRQKYKPGDNVLPRPRVQDKSPEERRIEEIERRMLEQAREMSLREAGVESSLDARRARRRHVHSHSEDTTSRSDRESSRDPRSRDGRDRSRRSEDRRQQPEICLDGRRRRRPHSISQDPSRDSSQTRRRQIEHQASIRSLISSSDIDSRDLEREIEDFARHIQEEGLLDGLNLDNLDELSRNDELSRKITEAYRRRQRERSRQESSMRGNASPATRPSESAQSLPRPYSSRPSSSGGQRSSSANTRPSTSTSLWDDRSRPPVTSTHLEVRGNAERRPRRRTSSGGRSATDPIRPSSADARPAARSQTDLTLASHNGEPSSHRPLISEFRSTSMPKSNPVTQSPADNPTERGLPFSVRATAAQNGIARTAESSADAASQSQSRRSRRPSDLVVPQAPLPSLGLLPSSPTTQQHRTRTQFYQEPSISCARCSKSHIEYELHYNCATCRDGNWNLCLNCYRVGKGCLHWFGFGYSAFKKWDRARAAAAIAGNENFDPPHMLTSNRYNPPKHTPGGADGRRTLTADDPSLRLESGSFCARCFTWANECFWRCDICNQGDWGFCNTCVNQGYSCTHPLLPLTYVAPSPSPSPSPQPHSVSSSSHHLTPPGTPRSPSPSSSSTPAQHHHHQHQHRRRPLSATLLTGPNAIGIGNFKPLTFTTTCDVCRGPIPPTQHRYHCFACVSRVVPDTLPGDYDICATCYACLAQEGGRIAPENGPSGWRRCLRGHRMAVVGFEETRGGQRRRVVRDVVGGVGLRVEPYESPNLDDNNRDSSSWPELQKWSWKVSSEGARLERLVTVDVAATVPPPSRLLLAATATGSGSWTDQFPPEGGAGSRALARWSWYPQPGAGDELLFPRGAEVREVVDVNGDWFHGSYMGAEGLFPSPYVRVMGEGE